MLCTYRSPCLTITYSEKQSAIPPYRENFLGDKNEEETAQEGEDYVMQHEERGKLEWCAALHKKVDREYGDQVAGERA